MTKRLPISAIILTHNEERNLPDCLASVKEHLHSVFVVDCFSTDRTLEIARENGCVVVQHPWKNYASQFQWALDNLPFETEWVLRLDADERWTTEGFEELEQLLSEEDLSGLYVRMKIFFMGRWMRHGGLYPNQFLRVFKRSGAKIEQRWMDEHIVVDGRTVLSSIDVIESNYDRQSDLTLWTTKHNRYSSREAADILIKKHGLAEQDSVADLFGNKTERKRWLKENFYNRLPPFARPAFYFWYRYLLLGGFLDGRPGLIFHVLQGYWYRFLVDAKVIQVERLAAASGRSIEDVIKESLGLEVRGPKERAPGVASQAPSLNDQQAPDRR